MSKRQLTTASAVIDRLGGNQPVAVITGRMPGAVSNWRRFNAFPPNTYLALTEALRAAGETAPDSLWGMARQASA